MFVPIFEGVHWREAVKRQWGNRKHGFSRLSTLRLPHVKKWGQGYYILLSSLLTPFHWPRNIWPWMTLMAWMVIVSYSNYDLSFSIIINVKKLTSLKLTVRTMWWYHSTKTAKIFWVTLDGATHGASISCPMHRVTQKIFAVLVEWYIVLTVSFKLVSFLHLCFTAEGRGMRTGQQCLRW